MEINLKNFADIPKADLEQVIDDIMGHALTAKICLSKGDIDSVHGALMFICERAARNYYKGNDCVFLLKETSPVIMMPYNVESANMYLKSIDRIREDNLAEAAGLKDDKSLNNIH